MEPTPFTVDVPQSEVDDLKTRLAATRWPNVTDEHVEERGLSLAWLKHAAEHWATEFDWRAAEADVNTLPQFTAMVAGTPLHFVHARGENDGAPVLLVHGWPDSFLRYRAVIPALLAAGHDVVVPSLPGFLFSGQPKAPLRITAVSDQLHEIVTGLGYESYVVSGGDWGASIADHLAETRPEQVVALHLTDVPLTRLLTVDRATATEAEQRYFAGADRWFQEAAYRAVQAAEPTALASGLSDSPVGLLAWIGAKFRDWSDDEPNLEELLTQVSLHWFTNDARSSLRLYSEALDPSAWGGAAGDLEDGDDGDDGERAGSGESGQRGADPRPRIPTAVCVFPKDLLIPPREYADRFYDVRVFTVHPRGGHFGATEQPDLFTADLLALLAEL